MGSKAVNTSCVWSRLYSPITHNLDGSFEHLTPASAPLCPVNTNSEGPPCMGARCRSQLAVSQLNVGLKRIHFPSGLRQHRFTLGYPTSIGSGLSLARDCSNICARPLRFETNTTARLSAVQSLGLSALSLRVSRVGDFRTMALCPSSAT